MSHTIIIDVLEDLVEPVADLFACFAVQRADAVHDHDAAEVSEPDLPGEFGGSILIDLERTVRRPSRVSPAGCIDIHGDERAGAFQGDVATGGQVHGI